MKVSKEQLINGVAKYARNEMLPKIPDKSFRMILDIGVSAMEINPKIADSVLENPLIKTMMVDQDGMYDIDMFDKVMGKTIQEYKQIDLSIPGIKFLSPETKMLHFDASDVEKIKRYVGGEA